MIGNHFISGPNPDGHIGPRVILANLGLLFATLLGACSTQTTNQTPIATHTWLTPAPSLPGTNAFYYCPGPNEHDFISYNSHLKAGDITGILFDYLFYKGSNQSDINTDVYAVDNPGLVLNPKTDTFDPQTVMINGAPVKFVHPDPVLGSILKSMNLEVHVVDTSRGYPLEKCVEDENAQVKNDAEASAIFNAVHTNPANPYSRTGYGIP